MTLNTSINNLAIKFTLFLGIIKFKGQLEIVLLTFFNNLWKSKIKFYEKNTYC